MIKLINKSLKKLESDVAKLYGKCYCSNLPFSVDKINEMFKLIKEIEYCLEDEIEYKKTNEFEDDYQDFFQFSIRKSIGNKEDVKTLDSAWRNYNKWASPCADRTVGLKEFKARVNYMGIEIDSNHNLILE